VRLNRVEKEKIGKAINQLVGRMAQTWTNSVRTGGKLQQSEFIARMRNYKCFLSRDVTKRFALWKAVKHGDTTDFTGGNYAEGQACFLSMFDDNGLLLPTEVQREDVDATQRIMDGFSKMTMTKGRK
jgi:hypothetical protein